MKKIVVLTAAILVVLIVGMFFIRDANSQEKDVEKRVKVGVILNGKKDDHSWVESHVNGLKISAQQLNLDIIYCENVPENIESVKKMKELIEEGCEIIICNSFGYGDAEMQVAKEYPEIYFFHATGTEYDTNFSSYFGRIYQMRYLSGIVAGLKTQTNEIGYVAAYPISEVIRGINAFTLGVRSVNPDATIHVSYSNSWGGDEEVANTTYSLLDGYDIDVFAMHTDSLKVLEIAEEKGIYSVGYNVDNSALFPNTFLTAPIWKWQNFYTPHIQECILNKFKGKNYWDGIETGMIDLAPLTSNVEEGTIIAVESARAEMENGNFDVFYGPIWDNEGNLRIPEGESMTDDNMLNHFDWYVEGVEVDE